MAGIQAFIFKKTHYTKRSSANWIKYHGYKQLDGIMQRLQSHRIHQILQ